MFGPREIKKIERLGVKFHLRTTIGLNFTVDDLFKQGFDAVFIGTGTGKPKQLEIPGINHPGVRQAIWFLRRVSLIQSGQMTSDAAMISRGDRVGVIGCGNTAMDAARTGYDILFLFSNTRMNNTFVNLIHYHTCKHELTHCIILGHV